MSGLDLVGVTPWQPPAQAVLRVPRSLWPEQRAHPTCGGVVGVAGCQRVRRQLGRKASWGDPASRKGPSPPGWW